MANELKGALGDRASGTFSDCRPAAVCEPRPVCASCGGLECLCRPRFYAGQLLSEEDLNRLDHYIVAKNRLHNRHLFGSGVVCGLEVVCRSCEPDARGSVTVRAGYALSPCGNDIVVCKDEAVDVCDLINRCRPQADDCLQPGGLDAPQAEEDWVLAICYREKPSRGLTALTGGSGGSCGCGGSGRSGAGGCGCGGGQPAAHASSGCGCGGGGATARTARTTRAARPGPPPPQCEPTLVCEDHTYAVYKLPPADDKRVEQGALIKRFLCCLQPLFEGLPALPSTGATEAQLQEWLRALIEAVRQFLIREGLYDCDLAARLGGVSVPAPAGTRDQYLQVWNLSALQVLEIVIAIFQKCLCAALLPPCPPPEMSDCVPIATVKVSPGRCRVEHVCNVKNRRFLVTWRTLGYWFSWLPLLAPWRKADQTLHGLLDLLCCTPVSQWLGFAKTNDFKFEKAFSGAPESALPGARARASVSSGPGLEKDDGIHPFTRLLAEAFLGGPEANPATILMAALGATAPDGSPLASDAALQHPGQAILTHQVLAPALGPLLPLLGLGARASGGGAVDELAAEVAELRRTVRLQQDAIDKLGRK